MYDLIFLLWLNERTLEIRNYNTWIGPNHWLSGSVTLKCVVSECKLVETKNISARTVPIMLVAVALECFSISSFRSICCGHVLVFVCGMVVCGHCSVCLRTWPVFVVNLFCFLKVSLDLIRLVNIAFIYSLI